MKIWHISDTHTLHRDLDIDMPSADWVIHSGDCCDNHDILINKIQWSEFSKWFVSLPQRVKILVGGNHDLYIAGNQKVIKKWAQENNIIYLLDQSVVIDGYTVFGSPFTPTYGNEWAFNSDRNSIRKHWKLIPDNTDILVTHGPPKGILDLSEDKKHYLEQCGDRALWTRMQDLKNLKLHCFGHIHDEDTFQNQGILVKDYKMYSNASCHKIGNNSNLSSKGNIITLV